MEWDTAFVQQISVAYEDIDDDLQNGIIKGYMVYYKSDKDMAEMSKNVTDPNIYNVTLENLRPNTFYNISIAGYNGAGVGKRSVFDELIKTISQSMINFISVSFSMMFSKEIILLKKT